MIKTVITLLVIIALLAGVSSFLVGKFSNREEIERAKLELEDTRALRDSLLTQVKSRDKVIAALEDSETDLRGEIDSLRVVNNKLEDDRKTAVQDAFSLFQPEDIMNEMKKQWPQMSRSKWGFMDIMDEEFQVEIEYFVIPTQFTTAFIQDHIDAVSYRVQVDNLRRADTLHQMVDVLQDSVLTLERENKAAYKTGYDDAYAKYEVINEKYVHLLENPQIKLGVPSIPVFIGSAAAGFVIGTVAK